MEKYIRKIRLGSFLGLSFIFAFLGFYKSNAQILVSNASQTVNQQETTASKPPDTTVIATVIFDANGGIFTSKGGKNTVTYNFTKEQIKKLDKKRIYKSDFPVPYKKGYMVSGWRRQSDNKKVGKYIIVKKNSVQTYIAQWKEQKYNITYHLNDGCFEETEKVVYNYTIKSEKIVLPKPVKKGFIFKGWYKNPSFQGSKVNYISKDSIGDIQLYAKWQNPTPEGARFQKVKKNKTILKIRLQKAKKAKGYEVSIATDSKFSEKNTAVYDLKKQRKLEITKPMAGTYYIKVRAYAYDDRDNKCYGAFSKVKTIVIKGNKKQYEAGQDSAVIKVAQPISKEKVSIQATIDKQVKSSDGFYYLMKVNPVNNKAETVIQKVVKSGELNFTLDTKDRIHVISKFGIAIKKKGKYKLISKPFYLDNIQKAAKNTSAYFVPVSKKGIHYAVEAYDLNAKYTICNLNVHDVLSEKGKGTPYVYGGKTYYFNSVLEHLVKDYNKRKINVTMVIYMPWNENNQFIITPTGREPGHRYYALNTTDKKARDTLEAMFSFLGEVYSQKDCLVSNWILGNEINSQKNWNYSGDIKLEDYAASYARAFVMLNNAVQSNYKNARVYIPLDGAWGLHNSEVGWSGRNTLMAVDTAITKENENVKWHLAYHAYSVPITGPSYKKNKLMKKHSYSPFIGMRNIDVLTEYIKETYGEDTSIILSEQGYTVYMGEEKQAASLAYAYYKAEFNPMIDAFIIVRVYDNQEEMEQGLAMGLIGKDGKHRKIYNVFKYMDTPRCEKYTKECLKTIKAKKWKDLVPEYTKERFK